MLRALPFLFSFVTAPLIVAGALYGGWWLAFPLIWGWVVTTLLDEVLGRERGNLDPATPDGALFWHRAVTWVWVPVQMGLIGFCLWSLGQPGHLGTGESLALMLGLGMATGGIGITFAHELVHSRQRWERALGELLLISNAYGHFQTEHIHGHHVTVATPADPVSARKGEGFWRFFPRAVLGSLRSAWAIDARRLARRGRPIWHHTNPFWRYGLGAFGFAALAWGFAGWAGVGWYGVMCLMGIYQLEAVNYVEHYGLTRRYLGHGKFERTQLHHSWNASHRVTNLFLINLQRHSDHHFRPDRRYPLLQTYKWREAPQLPFGYPIMVLAATNPWLWFAMMDKRVDRWRAQFYPDITDWSDYDNGRIGQASPLQGEAAA